MDSTLGFGPTKEVAGEKFRTWALNSSPNNILPSKVLCPCLEQGIQDDCSCLTPQQLQSSSASTLQDSPLNIPALESSLDSQTPRVSPSSTTQPSTTDTIYDSLMPLSTDLLSTRSSTDFLSSGKNAADSGTETPEAFFTAALRGSEGKRVKSLAIVVQQLASVARGFPKAEEFSERLSNRLSGWSNIFRSKSKVCFEDEPLPATKFETEVAHRLCRLEQVRHKIKRKNWADTRLWLILLAHELEHISQSEHIQHCTTKGVDPMSAAIKMACKYVDTASGDQKRARNIVQVMKEGGPASLLEDGGLAQSKWERFMTLDDVTYVFAYRRNNLQDLDKQVGLHNSEVSSAIMRCFMEYGWSSSRLQDTNTKVMAILKPYLQRKRLHADDESRGLEAKYKRCRVHQSGASTSLLNQDLLATSSRTYNNMELMLGLNSLHLFSFDARNRAMDLTDPAMTGNLGHAVNRSNEFSDPVTAGNLDHAVNNLYEFSDPVTAGNLGYAFNSSNEIIDLATANFLQSIDDQPRCV